MKYTVIIEKGTHSCGAYVPELPGCVAVANTESEVRQMIKEAIEFHIEGMKLDSNGLQYEVLNSEEIEDIALANAILKGRTGEFVDTDEFIKKLDEKSM